MKHMPRAKKDFETARLGVFALPSVELRNSGLMFVLAAEFPFKPIDNTFHAGL